LLIEKKLPATLHLMNPRKRALITGASSGIGYELAWIFAREGYDLVLVSRNEQKLRQLSDEIKQKYDVSVRVLPKDLSLSRSPAEIFIELEQSSLPIDILVNNAGFGTYGPFVETSLSDELDMLQLNMVSLTHLTKLFLKDMLKRGYGKILNVASTAAFQPGPFMAVYYATKAYVLSFSEALAEELRGTNVTVTCLCPGPTVSEFGKRAGVGNILLMKGRMMDSKSVAEIGYRALMKNQRVAVAGLMNRLLVMGSKLAPRGLTTRVLRILQRELVK